MSLRILVIDDEPAMIGAVAALVGSVGHRVSAAYDGHEALRRFDTDSPDLVILDLAMPGLDGVAVCREIRKRGATPIIILSGEGEEAAKVEALDAGADDYVTKPFGKDELLARIRAVTRRRDTPSAAVVGSVRIDQRRHEAWAGDRPLQLTPIEFALLEAFMRHPRRVLERSWLLNEVWGFDFPTTANSLEVYIGYLRRKTEAAEESRLIHTVRGVGYVLRETPP